MRGAQAMLFTSAERAIEKIQAADLELCFQLCGVAEQAGQQMQRARSKLHEGPFLKVPILHKLPKTVDLWSVS